MEGRQHLRLEGAHRGTRFSLSGHRECDGTAYVQHRGGPKGVIKVLDDHTLVLADFVGNSQAFMFLMDYSNRHRVKIWGTAEFGGSRARTGIR